MKNNFLILREKAIEFMHSLWAKDCLGNSELDIDTNNFNTIANNIFLKLTENKTQSKNPFMFRLAGQSGAGKTTQLMPSVQNIIENKNLNFINISVRMFSSYHPKYNELLQQFGEDLIREKTNGFALLMLFKIVEMLMKNKYNILFEVTILDNRFEEYLLRLSKTNRYNIHFHILSIPRKKSELWIEKRKNFSETEGNRVVLKSSSNFFYDILPITLNKIIDYKFWNKDDKIVLWNGFDSQPLIFGKIYKNKEFIKLFNKYRKFIDFEEKNEKELLKLKINWFHTYYADKI